MNHLVLVGIACLLGQAESSGQTGWRRIFEEQAHEQDIRPVARPDEPYRLLPRPVFHWQQPARGGGIGSIYLWLDATDRPAVIGQIFKYPYWQGARVSGSSGDFIVSHEFHSLTDEPFVAVWRDRRWTPAGAGVEWRPVPDAPAPQGSASARRSQMGLLLGRFRGQSTDPAAGVWELRTLPKPLYRYEQQTSQSQGGGLFAVCQGTDLEIVLLLESRRSGDAFQWQYAPAAFSDRQLRLYLDDEEVWSVNRTRVRDYQGQHLLGAVERRNAPPDAAEAPQE